MVRVAFSTVATPDWTLSRVAEFAEQQGFDGVELRTFGHGSGRFACDPGLTDASKVRRIFDREGLSIAGLASGLTLDRPIFPPVLGYALGEFDRPVEQAKPYVTLASEVGAPYLRVFGLGEAGKSERASRRMRMLILSRLRLVADAARHMQVRVLVENGGMFRTARALAELIDDVDSPWLAGSLALQPMVEAGEDVERGVSVMGWRLVTARVKDLRNGRPCPMGEGELPCEAFVRAVGALDRGRQADRWVVYEWDRAWLEGLAPAEQALPPAAAKLYGWLSAAREGVAVGAA